MLAHLAISSTVPGFRGPRAALLPAVGSMKPRSPGGRRWGRLGIPWCFTPCTARASLIEAVTEVARNVASSGDAVVLSRALSSHDPFGNHRGERFYFRVNTSAWGALRGRPNLDGVDRGGSLCLTTNRLRATVTKILRRITLRQAPEAMTFTTQSLQSTRGQAPSPT